MNKDKKFSEMLHGDIGWMKYQSLMNRETVQRAIRSGKSIVMLDAEHQVRGRQGFGKAMKTKREMATRVKVIRTIEAASPALAAEQRCTERGSSLMAVALMELRERNERALRLWNKVNWHHNYMEGRYNR